MSIWDGRCMPGVGWVGEQIWRREVSTLALTLQRAFGESGAARSQAIVCVTKPYPVSRNFSTWIFEQHRNFKFRLQATIRRYRCPEYPVQSNLFHMSCGINHFRLIHQAHPLHGSKECRKLAGAIKINDHSNRKHEKDKDHFGATKPGWRHSNNNQKHRTFTTCKPRGDND